MRVKIHKYNIHSFRDKKKFFRKFQRREYHFRKLTPNLNLTLVLSFILVLRVMLLKQRFSLVFVLILIITTEAHTRHSLKRKDHTGSKKEVIKSTSNRNDMPRNTNRTDNSQSLTKAIIEEIDKAAGDTSSISDEIEVEGSDNPQLLTTRSKSQPSFMDSVNEIEKVSIKFFQSFAITNFNNLIDQTNTS